MSIVAAQSTHYAAIVTGILAAASIAVTVVLAVFALGALRTSNKALEEAHQSRVDARAPSVLIDVHDPEWTLWKPTGVELGQTRRLAEVGAEEKFTLPKDTDQRLLVRYEFELTNYSPAITADVVIPAPFELVEPNSDDPAHPGKWTGPFVVDLTKPLAPHEVVRGALLIDRSLEEWAAPIAGGVSVDVRIKVSDQFDDGVSDTTAITLEANPLVAMESGPFRVRSWMDIRPGSPRFGRRVVHPAQRTYKPLAGRHEKTPA
jgi:hypothetical protein